MAPYRASLRHCYVRPFRTGSSRRSIYTAWAIEAREYGWRRTDNEHGTWPCQSTGISRVRSRIVEWLDSPWNERNTHRNTQQRQHDALYISGGQQFQYLILKKGAGRQDRPVLM